SKASSPTIRPPPSPAAGSRSSTSPRSRRGRRASSSPARAPRRCRNPTCVIWSTACATASTCRACRSASRCAPPTTPSPTGRRRRNSARTMLERRDSYEALYRDFRWRIPDRFNIGVAVSDRWAATEPDRTALFADNGEGEPARLSYGALSSRSNAFANALRAKGIMPGDRVALLLPQSFETAIAHVAIYKLGAIAVPLALLFGADALEYRLNAAGVKAVVTNEVGCAKLAAIRARPPLLETVVSIDGADAG